MTQKMHALTLKLKGKLIDLNTPIVMGIINITPDSFYSGSRFMSEKHILNQAGNMLEAGAKILDIGGYSTRPNAAYVALDEEIKRISVALEVILKKYPEACLSVDTFRAQVARHVVEKYGVAMINDISGGMADPFMFEAVASLDVNYILMHSKGNPQTMQQMTHYDDLMSEMMQYFSKKIAQLHLLGVKDVIVDPGFGFAKTLEQNYMMMQKMHYFQEFNLPILAGISRKSMIYNLLEKSPEEVLNGTTALHMAALLEGASILRVHDVREAMEAIKIYRACKQQ